MFPDQSSEQCREKKKTKQQNTSHHSQGGKWLIPLLEGILSQICRISDHWQPFLHFQMSPIVPMDMWSGDIYSSKQGKHSYTVHFVCPSVVEYHR